MTKKYFIFLVLIAVMIGGSSNSLAEETKIVTATTLLNFAPHTFEIPGSDPQLINETLTPGTDSKRLQGYAWDIFREYFHAMGYTIELRMSSWKRCLDDVAAGRIDVVFPASWNEEREKIYDYSKENINEVSYVIFFKDKESANDWSNLDAL